MKTTFTYYLGDSIENGKHRVTRAFVLRKLGAILIERLHTSGSLSCGSMIYSCERSVRSPY